MQRRTKKRITPNPATRRMIRSLSLPPSNRRANERDRFIHVDRSRIRSLHRINICKIKMASVTIRNSSINQPGTKKKDTLRVAVHLPFHFWHRLSFPPLHYRPHHQKQRQSIVNRQIKSFRPLNHCALNLRILPYSNVRPTRTENIRVKLNHDQLPPDRSIYLSILIRLRSVRPTVPTGLGSNLRYNR